MVDKVAHQTKVLKVDVKNQEGKSRGCGTKDMYLTLGDPYNDEVQ